MSKRQATFWLVVIAAFVLSDAPQWVMDALYFPWAHADPPLIDRWAGEFTDGNGDRLALVVLLKRTESVSGEVICYNCSQIEGIAVTCDARGLVRRYRISGTPKDRQGSQIHFGAVSDQSPPPDGLELDTLIGTWDHADTMTLAADFAWRRGTSAISSSDDPATQPVPVRLQRQSTANASAGTRAACG
jgi:hypothetical protein